MQAPKELRQFRNKMRRKYGKKNGKLPRHFWDHPHWELFFDNNRQRYDRKKEKAIPDDQAD